MHRPTLTLRRFGPMSFGLGYFENGIWVDHSIPDGPASPGSSDADASPSDGLALDAVHRWYGCCGDSIAAQPPVIATFARSARTKASVVAVMPLPVRAIEK